MADPNIAPEMGERKPMTFEKALTAHPEKPGVSGDAVGETTLKPGNGLVIDGGAL